MILIDDVIALAKLAGAVKTIRGLVEGPVSKVWRLFSDKRAAKAYIEDMKKLHGTLRILRMTRPMSLQGIFTDVNLLSKPSAFQPVTSEEESLLQDSYLGKIDQGRLLEKGKDGLDVVRKNPWVFLLGKPGAGKTTFLKHLVFKGLEGKIDANNYQIPIFITLRDFAASEQQSLFEFVVRQFQICDFPKADTYVNAMLKHGKALVLCDRSLLGPEDLDLGPEAQQPFLPLEKAKEDFQRRYVLEVLERNHGNRTQTARDLGVDPRTIFRYLEKEPNPIPSGAGGASTNRS